MRITGYRHSEDFQRVMAINDACYSGDFRPPREIMQDMISISDVFVARAHRALDPEIIYGFAIVRNATQPYIWNLAVDPAYWGRGIASMMLDHIIAGYTKDKYSQITLHVNAKNPAQKLYFDYGFRVTAIVPNYFNPDSGLLMERRLP
jgi:ribosomal protein S18 acetylase RimI-like enzyme